MQSLVTFVDKCSWPSSLEKDYGEEGSDSIIKILWGWMLFLLGLGFFFLFVNASKHCNFMQCEEQYSTEVLMAETGRSADIYIVASAVNIEYKVYKFRHHSHRCLNEHFHFRQGNTQPLHCCIVNIKENNTFLCKHVEENFALLYFLRFFFFYTSRRFW